MNKVDEKTKIQFILVRTEMIQTLKNWERLNRLLKKNSLGIYATRTLEYLYNEFVEASCEYNLAYENYKKEEEEEIDY